MRNPISTECTGRISWMLVSAGLFALACVPEFETDLSELREPRLLAIASEPAETQASKPVKLTALVAVPEGGNVSPLVDWSLCLARKPLTELGPINPSCLGSGESTTTDNAGGAASDEEAVLQPLGRGQSVETQVPSDACRLFGPLRPTPAAGEPAGRPVDPDVTGGFYQPVVAKLGRAVSLGAVRIDCDPANLNRDEALSYRRQYRVNENPRLSSLAIREGAKLREVPEDPLEVSARGAIVLRASWETCPTESACGDGYCTAGEDSASCMSDCSAGNAHGCTGAEQYVWFNRETQQIQRRREAISVAWYASSGHFESEQTGLDESQAAEAEYTENTWRVGAPAESATVWVVIRDSRGGQSWQIRHFRVVP